MAKLKKSKGIKRAISSLALALAGIVRAVPGGEPIAAGLEQVAAVFGTTGVVHAGVEGTVTKFKLASLASALSLLVFLGQFGVIDLAQIQSVLERLSAVVGGIGLGTVLGSFGKKKD